MDPETSVLQSDIPQHEYVTGDQTLTFHRCAKCGIATHWTGRDPALPRRLKINFNLANDPLPEELPHRHFDGANSWMYLD